MARQLSVTDLWSDGWTLAQRHLATAGPVVAAFLFLPQVLQAALIGTPARVTGAGAGLLQLAVLLAGLFGQVAVAAIMLGGPGDVAAALARARDLLPRVLAVIGLFVLVALPFLFGLGIIGALVGPAGATPGGLRAGTPGIAVLLVLLLPAMLLVGARLFVLFPVLLAEGLGARASIARTWRLTGGGTVTLVGFLVSFLLAAVFLTGVVNIVAGAVVGLLLGAKSSFGALLVATLIAAVAAVLALVSIAASVAAYRRLAE